MITGVNPRPRPAVSSPSTLFFISLLHCLLNLSFLIFPSFLLSSVIPYIPLIFSFCFLHLQTSVFSSYFLHLFLSLVTFHFLLFSGSQIILTLLWHKQLVSPQDQNEIETANGWSTFNKRLKCVILSSRPCLGLLLKQHDSRSC